MTAAKRTPVAVGAFLTAWEAVGAALGRKAITSGLAVHIVLQGPRVALSGALTQLGYPEALASGARLGAALRRLWGLRDEQGRYLERSRGAKGSIWYVVGPTAPAGTLLDAEPAPPRIARLLEDAAELAVHVMGGEPPERLRACAERVLAVLAGA